jgi:hypothetical protein
MTTISEIMGCASPTNTRPANDRYDTPVWCTEALARVESQNWPEVVWEPAAGSRAMSKILVKYACIVETDLIPFPGVGELDFLTTTEKLAAGIVTNPPYRNATEFIRHAFELGVTYHAWLLPAHFLNTQQRHKLVNELGYPARIWGLTTRPDFRGQKAPPMNCAWFVWDDTHQNHSRFELLSRVTP